MDKSLAASIGDLTHTDKNVRVRAAVDLGTSGNVNATSALVQALGTEPLFFVREYITWALVRMGEAALDPTVALLEDPRPQARHAAVHTLSKIGDQRALGALIVALHDADLSVVTKAVYALGELKNPAAIPALVDLLGREERELQATLVLALENFGRAALPSLLQAMGHDDWRVREQAASTLGIMQQPDAIPRLLQAFRDSQWQVRFAAVQALGTLDRLGASRHLTEISQDPDPRVRAIALRYDVAGGGA